MSSPYELTTDPVVRGLQERISTAIQGGETLRIAGAGCRGFLGDPRPGIPLSTLALQGIVDYQPSELVITARAGTPLAMIESTLAERGQYLAFEPPCFGPQDTVGGMVATGLSGPGRMGGGAVRDAVLGMVMLNGKGEMLRFGGQVIKNVAGYDVPRLMTGSLGSLGVILEVSLRVAPLPVADLTHTFELPQGQAIERVNHWLAAAYPIQASSWYRGQLHLRLRGAAAAVSAAAVALGGEALSATQAEQHWQDLRHHRHPLLGGDAELPLWRLAVPPTHPPLALAGPTLIEWHGGQRWLRSELDTDTLRAVAREAGGHATRFRSGRRSLTPGALTPPAEPMATIERALKKAFDPHAIFGPLPYASSEAG